MTKKIRLVVFSVLVLALIAFCLWYTRPMTLEELYPDMDWDSFTQLEIRAQTVLDTGYGPTAFLKHQYYYAIFTSEEVAFQDIATSLREKTFRRSLRSLLPYGSNSHPLRAGDFEWELYFSSDSGEYGTLEIENFFGRLRGRNIPPLKKAYTLSTSGKDAWLEEIFSIITVNVEPVDRFS